MPTPRDHAKPDPPFLFAQIDHELPFTVELWKPDRTAPERVIARSADMHVIRRMFDAAAEEFVGYKIVLRQGARIIQQRD